MLERVRHREMHGTRQEEVAWLMWDYGDNTPANNGFTRKCHSRGKVCGRLFKLHVAIYCVPLKRTVPSVVIICLRGSKRRRFT
jgi:hypothetical protein